MPKFTVKTQSTDTRTYEVRARSLTEAQNLTEDILNKNGYIANDEYFTFVEMDDGHEEVIG